MRKENSPVCADLNYYDLSEGSNDFSNLVMGSLHVVRHVNGIPIVVEGPGAATIEGWNTAFYCCPIVATGYGGA